MQLQGRYIVFSARFQPGLPLSIRLSNVHIYKWLDVQHRSEHKLAAQVQLREFRSARRTQSCAS